MKTAREWAEEILSLMAPKEVYIAHRKIPEARIAKDCGEYVEIALSGDLKSDVKELLGRVVDAMKAIGAPRATVMKPRGSRYVPRYAETYTLSPMDWHCTIRIWDRPLAK